MNRPRPLAWGLTLLGALARFLPHAPNFAPVGAMSLFAGARLRGWQAWLLPLVLMTVTDAVLGYSVATPFIYASFLVNVWIGRRLKSTENPLHIAAAALLCSAQFFLVSNFGVWTGRMYPHTLAGLAECYTAAIPFFRYTLAGDMVYSAVLFGLHAWLSRTVYTPERVSVQPA